MKPPTSYELKLYYRWMEADKKIPLASANLFSEPEEVRARFEEIQTYLDIDDQLLLVEAEERADFAQHQLEK